MGVSKVTAEALNNCDSCGRGNLVKQNGIGVNTGKQQLLFPWI